MARNADRAVLSKLRRLLAVIHDFRHPLERRSERAGAGFVDGDREVVKAAEIDVSGGNRQVVAVVQVFGEINEPVTVPRVGVQVVE